MQRTTPAAPPPRATKPPQPDLPLYMARALAFGCIALAYGREYVLPYLPPARALSPLALARDPGALPAILLRMLFEPPLFRLIWWIALGALAILLLELLWALLVALITTRRITPGATYLRVRPAQALHEPSQSALKPGALFRLIHGAPALCRTAWLDFEIHGAPDLPAEPGIVLHGTANKRQRMLALLTAALGSIAPDALLVESENPLEHVATTGRWIARQRFGLALGPEYPLHAPAERFDAELAGVLLSAIRPRMGVFHMTFSICLRPLGGAGGWALGRRWRGRAMALKLRLEQRQEYALAPDIAAIEARLADAAFETRVEAIVIAESEAAARAALSAIGDALGAFQHRTASRLQRFTPIGSPLRKQIRPGVAIEQATTSIAPPPTLLLPIQLWRGPNILSAGELGYLWHLPAGMQNELVRHDSYRHINAPPHAYGDTSPERIVLGHARRANGSWTPVGPTLRDLRQILHITAGMGAGKSRLLANLCRQFLPHGFMLIDGKGDDRGGSLVTTVRQLIPLAAEARLALLDPLDTDWPIGLNPLAGSQIERSQQGSDIDLALGQILATFARIDPETWGHAPGMQQFARMATLLVLEGEPHPTMAHVKQALLDPEYRECLLQAASNIEVSAFWREIYPRLGESQRASSDALLRRFDALLTAETTRYLVTQERSTLDIAQAIDSRMIILAPLPDITLGGLAGAVGALVLQAFIRAAFSRAGVEQERNEYPLIVDELQVLISTGDSADLATAITRLRSLGIAAIYAHQALAQLGDMRDLMLINAGNRILLQTQEPDAGIYARMYGAQSLTAADISGQNPTEHQYAVIRCCGVAAGPFSLRPLPWPAIEEAAPPAYHGPPWQSILPDQHDPADEYICRLVYQTASMNRAADELARLDSTDWRRLQDRWERIRHKQRTYILANPGCIPERMERQRWLSRLLVAYPRLFAAAEYLRIHEKYRVRKP